MPTNMNPYLTFDGTCADAMTFYQKTLGGKLDVMKIKDSPPSPNVPAGDGDRVMHARLVFDGGTIMASDCLSNMKCDPMQGISLAVSYDSGAAAKKVFDALAAGGRVTMPLNETFFAEAFGSVVDRFGTPWMITGGMKQLG